MSTLNASISNATAQIKTQFAELIRRIEESALYERLVMQYESLEPRQQKWIQASLVLSLITAVSVAFLWPVGSTMSHKSVLGSQRRLIAEMRAFQDEISVVRKPAPRPVGFQTLPIGNAQEFEESLKQFAGSIDLGGDVAEIALEKDVVSVTINELSVRQALSLLFQVDGWYPAVRNEKFKIEVNPDNRELLRMEMQLRYVDGAGAPVGAGGSGTTARNGGGSSDDGMEPLDGAAPRTGGSGSPRSDAFDDDEDIPPPLFEEDL